MLQLRVHADIQWYLDALHCMVLLHPPAMRPKHTGRNRLACGGQSFECVGWSEVTSGGVETPTTMSCWLHGNWIKVLIYPYDVLGGSEKLFTYLGAFAPVGCVIRGNCHLHTSGVKVNQLAMCSHYTSVQLQLMSAYIWHYNVKVLQVIWLHWWFSQSAQEVDTEWTHVVMEFSRLSKGICGISNTKAPNHTSRFSLQIILYKFRSKLR